MVRFQRTLSSPSAHATETKYRRFLQCIRRYKDTRNIFPHLVNCGKYTASILAGVFLSVYRINNTHSNLALFIAFSTVNGLYTGKSVLMSPLERMETVRMVC